MIRDPFDFRAVIAPAIEKLSEAHRRRSREHVQTRCGTPTQWMNLESMHDVYDRALFNARGLPRANDEWDNRRTGKR